MDSPETMTVREVAALLRLHPQTIYTAVKERRFPIHPLPLPQRRVLFARADVLRFLGSTR